MTIQERNNGSTQLLQVYKKFLSNVRLLLDTLKTLRKLLFDVEKTLLISKQLSDKLNELYILLLSVDATLMALIPVPYVGAVAKVVQKVVSQIKKIIKQAKDKVNTLENKIKPHREKIARYRGYIDKIVKPLLQIESFVSKKEQMLTTTYNTTSSLPNSRYKNLSLDGCTVRQIHSTTFWHHQLRL